VDTMFGSAETKTLTLSTTKQSLDTSSNDLPSVTSFTLMPRAGYLLRVNDRLSFWPRIGIGYFSGANVTITPTTDATTGKLAVTSQSTTISSLIFQIDVGLIYQVTDNVFFRAAPAITFSNGGSGKITYKNSTNLDTSGNGSAFQFELTSGFGANF